MPVAEILKALTVLAPLIEELVDAFRTGQTPDFISKLPARSRARVALEARKAGLK